MPAAHASAVRQLFLDASAAIRSLDPAVSRVEERIIRSGGFSSACGRHAGDHELLAFYCPADRTVYATVATLVNVNQTFGSAGLRYLVAHEMGHARQHAVTGYSKNIIQTSVLDELQADCIAGAYLNRLYGYTDDSPGGEEVRRFAYSIGDRDFTSLDWHGNPRLRVAALTRGLRHGDPAKCLSSSRYNYGTMLEQGQNWLRQLRQR